MKKKTVFRVPVSWVRAYPRHGFSYVFWLAVARRVRERGIRKNDIAAVRAVCVEVTSVCKFK
jgi:hypothetical protein